jgi:hypothetical protein
MAGHGRPDPMMALQTRLLAPPTMTARPVSRPVGVYWLGAGVVSISMWAVIFYIADMIV